MKKRKLFISILAGIMAAVMILSLLLSLLPTRAYAQSSSEIKTQINALEAQREELQAQMDELEAQQNENLSDIQEILDQKNLIDQQIGILQAQILNINDQIAAQNLLIADKQDELDVAEERLAELNEKNKERIRTMEEEGNLSYWSVLFKANSFADLLDRLNMVEEIAAADQRRLQDLRTAAVKVETARSELTLEKENLEANKAELADSQNLLDEKRAEADALILELLAKGAELDAAMEEFEDKEQDLLQEIAAREEEYNRAKQREYEQWLSTSVPATNNNSSSNDDDDDYFIGGDWLVPCSYVYVSSPFQAEGRLHPVLGYVRPHYGIDLAAYQGTPIYATRGGTVTNASYDGGSGYYVSINHGDGFSSVYMHMTHYVVSAGEHVSQGEVIGYVGSTGWSTGAHLHFAISKNGSYVNPANYIAF